MLPPEAVPVVPPVAGGGVTGVPPVPVVGGGGVGEPPVPFAGAVVEPVPPEAPAFPDGTLPPVVPPVEAGGVVAVPAVPPVAPLVPPVEPVVEPLPLRGSTAPSGPPSGDEPPEPAPELL